MTVCGSVWLNRSQAGLIVADIGVSKDIAVQADYTGDGKVDVAFFRPSTSERLVLKREDFSFYFAPFGTAGDVPIPGDYDRDGKSDLAVFRPSNRTITCCSLLRAHWQLHLVSRMMYRSQGLLSGRKENNLAFHLGEMPYSKSQ